MVDRRWIEDSTDVDVLENRLLQFYGINDLDQLAEPPELNHAARQSTDYSAVPDSCPEGVVLSRQASRATAACCIGVLGESVAGCV